MRWKGQDGESNKRTIRIISVIAATAIALSSGTNYAFSAWSPQYAERLQLSATQTNLIGNFGNMGMYAVGIPGGLLIDSRGPRWGVFTNLIGNFGNMGMYAVGIPGGLLIDSRGPRWGVFVGCIGLSIGYFSLRSAYLNGPGSMSVAALCFFSFLSGVASCTAFTASIKVSATNWPHHRGTATAFPLSAFGLSALVFTMLAGYLMPGDTAGYLLLLACGTTVMVFIGMFFLQTVHSDPSYQPLPTSNGRRRDSNALRRTPTPQQIGESTSGANWPANSQQPTTETVDETSSLVSSESGQPGDIEDGKPDADYSRSEITGVALVKSPQFWRLFILLGLLCGVGLMTINNIGNNARSLWHHWDGSATHDFIQQRQLVHVSIISFTSFLGRLGSGIGSDYLVRRNASRFWTLVVSATFFTAGQLVALNLDDPNYLWTLSALNGLGYGALFGVYPALVADAFGSSGMALNWGAMVLAPVICGNLFNLAYGAILDHNSQWEEGDRVCEQGRKCYSDAYLVTLLASICAIFWTLWCIREEKVDKREEDRLRR